MGGELNHKFKHLYSIEEILERYNKASCWLFPSNINIPYCGYDESENNECLYPKLIRLNISTGFFKIKPFVGYFDGDYLEEKIIINIYKLQRYTRYGNEDIEFIKFLAKAQTFNKWILNPLNKEYVALYSNRQSIGFFIYKNILIPRLTLYRAFIINNCEKKLSEKAKLNEPI